MFLGDGFTRRGLIRFQQFEIVHLASCMGTNEALLFNRLPRTQSRAFPTYLTVKLMLRMNQSELAKEAEQCRLQALSYLGTREASFLLRVAREFDDLADRAASERHRLSSSREQPAK